VFNEFSDRGADVQHYHDFLRNYIPESPDPAGQWKSHLDMMNSMYYARLELDNVAYANHANRVYTSVKGTSWLTYYAFTYQPTVPADLEEFLADAVNRESVLAAFTDEPGKWAAAVKVPLPLSGTVAYVLNKDAWEWLNAQRDDIITLLSNSDPESGIAVVQDWLHRLDMARVPTMLVLRVESLLRARDWKNNTLLF
jgi:hypothetical protein